MNTPKVTICIPTYNHGRFLPEAIESVLNQTFTDYELLIVDDCSQDTTSEVVRLYAARDGRIRFKVNETNIGMVNNWNLCLADAHGEYVKPLFSDDTLSCPSALEMMVRQLDDCPGVTLVGSARNIIDEDSRTVKVLAHFKDSAVYPGHVIINRCLSEQKNLIGEPSAVMFRRFDSMRGFMPHYRQIVDLEMWFHLLEQGDFAHIREPLCSFRMHPAQQTALNARSFEALGDNFHLYDEYMHKPYIAIGAFHRRYIRYDSIYRIWKMHRQGLIPRQLALMAINERYSSGRFFLLYPFYKAYKPLLKLSRMLGKA